MSIQAKPRRFFVVMNGVARAGTKDHPTRAKAKRALAWWQRRRPHAYFHIGSRVIGKGR